MSPNNIRLERLKNVKHHSTTEKYMAHGDRWDGLRVAEGWD